MRTARMLAAVTAAGLTWLVAPAEAAALTDTLVPANRYLLTLTATGGGTCGATGPMVQIADFDVQGIGNPVTASTSGACALYHATVF